MRYLFTGLVLLFSFVAVASQESNTLDPKRKEIFEIYSQLAGEYIGVTEEGNTCLVRVAESSNSSIETVIDSKRYKVTGNATPLEYSHKHENYTRKPWKNGDQWFSLGNTKEFRSYWGYSFKQCSNASSSNNCANGNGHSLKLLGRDNANYAGRLERIKLSYDLENSGQRRLKSANGVKAQYSDSQINKSGFYFLSGHSLDEDLETLKDLGFAKAEYYFPYGSDRKDVYSFESASTEINCINLEKSNE
ncbi:MAG: hypothetical protein KDD50_12200 [Bdellovibrionales bacterium]|nr:hypothetical protein [Bdellovibrionales bacterium]